jgi:hypothetical protein
MPFLQFLKTINLLGFFFVAKIYDSTNIQYVCSNQNINNPTIGWVFLLLQKYMTAQIYNMYATTKILTAHPVPSC